MRHSLVVAVLLLLGVVLMNVAAADNSAEQAKQGVSGKIVALKGNFMPGPGPVRGAQEPLSVPVHVFRGKVEVTDKPDPKHPALVKTVKADEKGEYRVALEPGDYTVVAEIDGKLYLNVMEFDSATGKAVWPTVKVQPGKWTPWTIKDTSGAAF